MNSALISMSGSAIASILVKTTLVAAIGLIGVRLARTSKAALRHTLLLVTFGTLVILPVASIVAPRVEIAIARKAPVKTSTAGPIVVPGLQTETASAANSGRTVISAPLLVLAGWICGVLIFAVPIATGLWQVRSLRRSSLPWPSAQSPVDELSAQAGIRNPVQVMLHERLAGPMICGTMRPAIVLPVEAKEWERADLMRALVHELEHVRRHDWATHCIARAVCAVYWFHPLAWMAWRRLELEAERSCDDAVLACSEATAYADQLVRIAQRLSEAGRSPLLAMAKRADLTTRVRAVLNDGQKRGRAGRMAVAAACVAAAVAVCAISPLRIVASPQTDTQPGGTVGRFRASSSLVVTTVTASDSAGRNIEGLTANDFVVTENGAPQAIKFFEFRRMDDGQAYYMLGYYTFEPQTGEFRKIEVKLKNDPSAVLKFREGYRSMRIDSPAPPPTGHAAVVTTDLVMPRLISKVEPEYTEEARKAKYQGVVLLRVEIDASGTVTAAQPLRAIGLGLDEKAVEAVRKWRFRPATRNGTAVPIATEVEVHFRLL